MFALHVFFRKWLNDYENGYRQQFSSIGEFPPQNLPKHTQEVIFRSIVEKYRRTEMIVSRDFVNVSSGILGIIAGGLAGSNMAYITGSGLLGLAAGVPTVMAIFDLSRYLYTSIEMSNSSFFFSQVERDVTRLRSGAISLEMWFQLYPVKNRERRILEKIHGQELKHVIYNVVKGLECIEDFGEV